MSKIQASSLIVGDDELELRDADAQKKIMEIIEKINKILEGKIDKTSIVHTTGAAEDKVMSQAAATVEFGKKFDKSNVVQTTGNAEDKVMSQAAATVEFTKLSGEIADQKTDVDTKLTEWNQGAYNSSTGKANELTSRVRHSYVYIDADDVELNFPEDKETLIYTYNGKASSEYVGLYIRTWAKSPVHLNGLIGKYITIALRNPDDSDIVPSDINGVTITALYNTDKTLSKDGKAADAKETGDRLRAVTNALIKTHDLTNQYVRTGKYIALDGGVGNVVSTSPMEATGHRAYIICSVSKGDKLTLYGSGGSASRLWGLTDKEYVLLKVSAANIFALSDDPITIDVAEDGYFISNVSTASKVGYGLTITKISDTETYDDHLQSAVDHIASTDRFIYSSNIKNAFYMNVENLPEHPWDANNGVYSAITVEQVYELYDNLVDKYDGELTSEIIGTGSDGQIIKAYRLTPSYCNTPYAPYRPTIMVTCATHGWEKCGTETMLLLLELLRSSWDLHPVLETLRFDVNWIIVPIVNTYGFDHNTRKNGNGVDINRNYPNGWLMRVTNPESSTYQGESELSESESQAVYSLMEAENVDIGIDFHDFGDSSGNGIVWVVAQTNKVLSTHLAQTNINKIARRFNKQFPFLSGVDSNTLGKVTAGNAVGKTSNAYYATGAKFAYTFETCGVMPLEDGGKRFDDTHALACIEAFVNFVAQNLIEIERVAYSTDIVSTGIDGGDSD